MAQITIKTTENEQQRVLIALRKLQGETIPVSKIAHEAHMNPNRARYVLMDLIAAGKVTREATKAFNKNYIRYKYTLVEDANGK